MDQREVFNARVRQLRPIQDTPAEDAAETASQALAREFRTKFGITYGEARDLFDDGNPFKIMIGHMYQDALAEMLNCDLVADGARIQGGAQLLNLFLHIPEEIAKINEVDIED